MSEKMWSSDEPCILGIDEAGRGPALGPMVYSAAYCAKSDHDRLVALGAADSKQLTEETRARLRTVLDAADFVGSDSIVLHAASISSSMLRPAKYNLNAISHDAALGLVQRALDAGVNVVEVYVDTVGNADTYAQKFRDAFPALRKVVVEAKADGNYRIVGAASIVAKTERDRAVKDWVFPEEALAGREGSDSGDGDVVDVDDDGALTFERNYGSGYPSDPKTKAWMRANLDTIFGFPSFVRFSWGPAKLMIKENAALVKWYVCVSVDAGACHV